MRRFLLTSEGFKGTIEVWYDFNDMLARIDFIDAQLSFDQVQFLPKNISASVETFAGLMPKGILIKEWPFEITLNDFKREYPYSRNYHLLEPMWPKYNKKEQVLIYFRAIDYRKYCEANKAWYTPQIAATWLNKKEYLNNWKGLLKSNK